jgi:hypothetical protein
MSYQPQVPAGFQPAPPPAKRKGTAWIVLGVLFIVGGLVAGAVMYFVTQGRYDSKVKNLASDSAALSGCTTTMSFTKSGTFVLYYIFEGDVRINDRNDDCAEEDVVTIKTSARPPDFTAELRNSDGKPQDLNRPSISRSRTLSAGGVKARPYQQARVTRGNYALEVVPEEANADRFAIGVGPAIEEPSSTWPVLLAGGGAALGLIFIVIGSARRGRSGRARGVVVPGDPGAPVAVGAGYPQGPPLVNPPGPVGPTAWGQPSQPDWDQPGSGQPPWQPPGSSGPPPGAGPLPPIVRSPEALPPFQSPPAASPPTAPTGAPGEPWGAPPTVTEGDGSSWNPPGAPPGEDDDQPRPAG